MVNDRIFVHFYSETVADCEAIPRATHLPKSRIMRSPNVSLLCATMIENREWMKVKITTKSSWRTSECIRMTYGGWVRGYLQEREVSRVAALLTAHPSLSVYQN